jgi:hypothetical protein
MAVIVYKFQISKDQLQLIPDDERNLLLWASTSVNQISVMSKLLRFNLNFGSENEAENTLSGAQSQVILRYLFGTLAESWEMLKRPINQKLIGVAYKDAIGAAGDAGHDRLKKHFGATNLLHTIRNTFAYHSPHPEVLQAAFAEATEDESWVWYLGEMNDNSFYLASDIIIITAILKETGEADFIEAYKKIMGVVVPVSNDLIDFLNLLIRAIVVRHLGEEFLSKREKVPADNAPRRERVSIPFFTEIDDTN